jgi:hypothetical protein
MTSTPTKLTEEEIKKAPAAWERSGVFSGKR